MAITQFFYNRKVLELNNGIKRPQKFFTPMYIGIYVFIH